MNKYKILWIDDEYEKLSYLMERCELMHGFEITKCRFAEEGMKVFEQRLDEWSAIVLDAKMLLRSLDEAARLNGLRFCRDRINELRPKRYVPSFIFTGQPDLVSNDMFEQMVSKYYSKGDDDDKLIEDIKSEADKLIETQIIDKYNDVISAWPNLRKELIDILKVLEENDNRNATVMNQIRKVLEEIMTYFYESGISQVEFKESNLAECSRFIGQPFMSEIVPLYVQRSLHSCVSITNKGSHKTSMDKDIQNGKASYLIRSTIYELLNVLEWCHRIPKDKYLVMTAVKQLIDNNKHGNGK